MIRSTPGRKPNTNPLVEMVALGNLSHKDPESGAPSLLKDGDEFKIYSDSADVLERSGHAKRKAKPAPLPPKPKHLPPKAKASKKGGR